MNASNRQTMRKLKIVCAELKCDVDILAKVRREVFPIINNGSAPSHYIAALTDGVVSLAHSLTTLVENDTPAGLPAIVRVIVEQYTKAMLFFDPFVRGEQCFNTVKQEIDYQITHDNKILEGAMLAIKRLEPKNTRVVIQSFAHELMDAMKSYIKIWKEQIYNGLDDEKVLDRFCDKLKEVKRPRYHIAEEVGKALVENRTRIKTEGYADEFAECVYPMLCQGAHANILAVIDQSVDEDNTIWLDLPPYCSVLYIRIVRDCILDLTSYWDEVESHADDYNRNNEEYLSCNTQECATQL